MVTQIHHWGGGGGEHTGIYPSPPWWIQFELRADSSHGIKLDLLLMATWTGIFPQLFFLFSFFFYTVKSNDVAREVCKKLISRRYLAADDKS